MLPIEPFSHVSNKYLCDEFPTFYDMSLITVLCLFQEHFAHKYLSLSTSQIQHSYYLSPLLDSVLLGAGPAIFILKSHLAEHQAHIKYILHISIEFFMAMSTVPTFWVVIPCGSG